MASLIYALGYATTVILILVMLVYGFGALGKAWEVLMDKDNATEIHRLKCRIGELEEWKTRVERTFRGMVGKGEDDYGG